MNQSLLSLIRPNVHGSLLCTNVFNHICRAIFPKLTQSMKMCIVAICYPIVFVHWSGYIFFSVCDANSGHVHWVLTTTWMNTHIRIIDNNAVQLWHMAAIGLSEFWKIAPQLYTSWRLLCRPLGFIIMAVFSQRTLFSECWRVKLWFEIKLGYFWTDFHIFFTVGLIGACTSTSCLT